MKEIYYTYNNEAIASCLFLELLQKVKTIDTARSCLILPFLLDDKTVKYFQKLSDEENISLEYIAKEQPRLFTSFNKRYLSLLPVTINSLLLLNKNNQIRISSSGIYTKSEFLYEEIDMGNRFNEIKKALPIFIRMIERYSTVQLYRILKIQL
ncbi:three component ABC system middle component [Butyricimonas hominis]|uniref:Uncharacterized protein n=1 Tax=Butyricimonas hominis TaxID=2763032 RepID=A0ABR7CY92_9BACT|nr:three component ABC system middle component [Butyricimonas hominis]MBC5620290.1 hypothetical protein [Butyricimonas hominis]